MNTDEIRARVDAATPGPWYTGDGSADMFFAGENTVVTRERVIAERATYNDEYDRQTYADIRFIAHAPEDIAYLLEQVAAMTAERDRYRRMALDMMVDLFKPTFVNRDGTERPTALAVDFDGTLCEQAWPGIGNPNMWLIERLVSFREQGGELILWTNREGEPLQAAVDFCAGYGLRFDAVNANLPRWMEFFKNDTRKPGADYYIDDKAVCIKAEWRGPDGQHDRLGNGG